MSFRQSKELLAKDYQYCDLLGNDLLQDCLGEYTNEELKNLKEEDWAIFELKRELKDKVGEEKRHLDSGIKPSSAGKVKRFLAVNDRNILLNPMLTYRCGVYQLSLFYRYIPGEIIQTIMRTIKQER